MVDAQGLIWIEDAVNEYGRSRAWFNAQLREGTLSAANIPGDRRVYLVRAEVEALIQPRITRRDTGTGGGTIG